MLCVGLLCVGSGLIQFWQNGINKEKERTRQDTGQESDVTQLVVAVPYSGVPEEDMKLMEEKVNAILREKIQMEVKFVWSSHYKNMVNLMLAGGNSWISCWLPEIFLWNPISTDIYCLWNSFWKPMGRGFLRRQGKMLSVPVR